VKEAEKVADAPAAPRFVAAPIPEARPESESESEELEELPSEVLPLLLVSVSS